MPHPLHQLRSQGFAEMPYHFCSSIAILGIYPDLNEFVMVEGEIDFIQHCLGQAATPDDDHRFPGMSKTFKVAFLNVVQHVA